MGSYASYYKHIRSSRHCAMATPNRLKIGQKCLMDVPKTVWILLKSIFIVTLVKQMAEFIVNCATYAKV